MAKDSYTTDLKLLGEHTEIVELAASDGARVVVATGYQGRVMTSTLAGVGGASFGWLNSEFIASGRQDEHFNNYGGEDRFWLGPEGGQYALWFKKGEPFDLDHWVTPKGFSSGPFEVTSQSEASIAMARRFQVTNYSETTFDCAVKRTINMLDAAAVAANLSADISADATMVAYESVNTLANAGDADWARDAGLLCIWILGMLKPLARGKVIVPFRAGADDKLGVKVTTDYFGEITPDRCRVGEDHVLFTCDGKCRSKIGISPARAKDVFGSFDPDGNILTIVQFNLPADAAESPYVNNLWKMQDDPFAGDAVNSYNDGEAEPGAGQIGPFYELETCSPAAELAGGEEITHVHRTCHFSGPFDVLNALAGNVLGVDLKEIQ